MDTIKVDGRNFDAYTIKTTNASMLIIRGGRGMLACGYVKLETADRLGDILAVVSGVNSYADMLEKPVVGVSKSAAAIGIKVGMSGEDALRLLA